MQDAKPENSCASTLLRRLHAPIYRRRISVLTDTILAYVQANDLLLDVGCGSGALGRALLDCRRCPAGVRVIGLESNRRGGEAIDVQAYDGHVFPYGNNTVDLVILADVLHHEACPDRLLAEAIRVTKRIIFIKDHKIEGFLAQPRICVLDWAANTGYGVKCLFRYNTKPEWNRFLNRFSVRLTREINCIDLYPAFFNLIFGRRLHYCAVLDKSAGGPSP